MPGPTKENKTVPDTTRKIGGDTGGISFPPMKQGHLMNMVVSGSSAEGDGPLDFFKRMIERRKAKKEANRKKKEEEQNIVKQEKEVPSTNITDGENKERQNTELPFIKVTAGENQQKQKTEAPTSVASVINTQPQNISQGNLTKVNTEPKEEKEEKKKGEVEEKKEPSPPVPPTDEEIYKMFAKINSGLKEERLKQWIEKSKANGWEPNDPIPDIKEIKISDGPKGIPIIEAFTFTDAYTKATQLVGEGNNFYWKKKISGEMQLQKVYYGSEETKFNIRKHKFSKELVHELYLVSGDKKIYDKALARGKISDAFTALVKDAQKVLYLDDDSKWTGMLTEETQGAITEWMRYNMTDESMDASRITAHYLIMIDQRNIKALDIMAEYYKKDETQELLKKIDKNTLRPITLRTDQVKETTIGSLGGYGSVSGQRHAQKVGEQEQKEMDLKEEGNKLRSQLFAGLDKAFKAKGLETKEQLLNDAIEKYSISLRENGPKVTVDLGKPVKGDLSSGTMGTSTYVQNTTVPPSGKFTYDYKDKLNLDVKDKEERLKEKKFMQGVDKGLNEAPKDLAEIRDAAEGASREYLKQAVEMMKGVYKDYFDAWLKVNMDLRGASQEEGTAIPDDVKNKVASLHAAIRNFADKYTLSYMGKTQNEYYPDISTIKFPGFPLKGRDGKIPPAGSYDALLNSLHYDIYVFAQIIRRKLDLGTTVQEADIKNNWKNTIDNQLSINKNIRDNSEGYKFTPLPASFFAAEDLATQVNRTNPTAAAQISSKGIPLQLFWAKKGEEYVVRLILRPNEDPITLKADKLENALKKLNEQKVLPEGKLFYRENGETRNIYTYGGMLLSQKLGIGSIILLVIGVILTPFTAGGSLVVTVAFVGAAALGVAASATSMWEHSETGTLTKGVVLLESANIAANLLGGWGAIAKLKGVGVLATLGLKNAYALESGIKLFMGGTLAANMYVFSEDVYKQLKYIKENIPSGPEQNDAVNRVITFAVLWGLFMVVAMKVQPKTTTNTSSTGVPKFGEPTSTGSYKYGEPTVTGTTQKPIYSVTTTNRVPALKPYGNLTKSLSAVQGTIGIARYYEFESVLKDLPENILKKLDNEPELLEAFAKKSLSDPEFAKSMKMGEVEKMEALKDPATVKQIKKEWLQFHEKETGVTGKQKLGHTILKHVGTGDQATDDAQICVKRFDDAVANGTYLPSASSYSYSKTSAESELSRGIGLNRENINIWLKNSTQTEADFIFPGNNVGRSLTKQDYRYARANNLDPLTYIRNVDNMFVLLRKTPNGKGYYIHTSYPTNKPVKPFEAQ